MGDELKVLEQKIRRAEDIQRRIWSLIHEVDQLNWPLLAAHLCQAVESVSVEIEALRAKLVGKVRQSDLDED